MNHARNRSAVDGFLPLSLLVVALLFCVVVAKSSSSFFAASPVHKGPNSRPAETRTAGAINNKNSGTSHSKTGSPQTTSTGHKGGAKQAAEPAAARTSDHGSAPAVALLTGTADKTRVPAQNNPTGALHQASSIGSPRQRHESPSTNPGATTRTGSEPQKSSGGKAADSPKVVVEGNGSGGSFGSNSPVTIGSGNEIQSNNSKDFQAGHIDMMRTLGSHWNGISARSASFKKAHRRSRKVVRHRKKKKNGRPSVEVKGRGSGGSGGPQSPVTVGNKDAVQSNNGSPVTNGSAPGAGAIDSPNAGSTYSGPGDSATNNGTNSGAENNGPGDGSINNGPNSGSENNGPNSGSTYNGTNAGSTNNGSDTNNSATGENSVGSITGSNGAGGSSTTTVITTITSTTTTTTTSTTLTSNNSNQQTGQSLENTVTTTLTVTNE
jgi:hypothetical protein